MVPDEAYTNLTPNIADALERAETKYKEALNPANPYIHLPLLASARILGAEFLAYQNTDATLPESLAQSPIVLHSKSARFHPMCLFISAQWLSDFPSFVQKVTAVESAFRAGENPRDVDEWALVEYGLQAAPDAYIVGFSGPDTATITNKSLILRILILSADAFLKLPGKNAFDAAALKHALESFCVVDH